MRLHDVRYQFNRTSATAAPNSRDDGRQDRRPSTTPPIPPARPGSASGSSPPAASTSDQERRWAPRATPPCGWAACRCCTCPGSGSRPTTAAAPACCSRRSATTTATASTTAADLPEPGAELRRHPQPALDVQARRAAGRRVPLPGRGQPRHPGRHLAAGRRRHAIATAACLRSSTPARSTRTGRPAPTSTRSATPATSRTSATSWPPRRCRCSTATSACTAAARAGRASLTAQPWQIANSICGRAPSPTTACRARYVHWEQRLVGRGFVAGIRRRSRALRARSLRRRLARRPEALVQPAAGGRLLVRAPDCAWRYTAYSLDDSLVPAGGDSSPIAQPADLQPGCRRLLRPRHQWSRARTTCRPSSRACST